MSIQTPKSTWGLLMALSLVTGCGRPSPNTTPAQPAIPVQVAVVERVEEPEVLSLPGTVRAVDRAVISSKVAGTIVELPWGLGQRVEAGALLIRLSAPEYAAQVSRARATLEQAERELARDRALLQQGAATGDAVRRGQEQLKSAQAGLAEAEAMLAYTEIRAPFAGRITARQAYPGDMALPGQSLLTLEGVDQFEVDVAVPESYVRDLTLGAVLPVEIQSGRVPATVAEISAGADVASRSVLTKLRLGRDAAVSSGQFVRVWVNGPQAARLRIPAKAVTTFGQMERVFVVNRGQAQLRLVRTGSRNGDRVEITSGLEAGESVVLNPGAALRDGSPVEIRP